MFDVENILTSTIRTLIYKHNTTMSKNENIVLFSNYGEHASFMKQVKKSRLPYINFKIIYTIGSHFKTNYISFTDDNLLYRIGYKYDDDENDSIPNIGKIKKGKKRILILNNASRYTFDCSLKCNYDNELCFEFLYGYEFTIQVDKVKNCKKKHIID